MAHPFAPALSSRFESSLLVRLGAHGAFEARLGCELVHVSTSEAVADLVARFQDLDDDSQAAVLARLETLR